MKALVVRLSALGDVVLTTGVLRHWHTTLGLKATVLTRAAFAPVFAHHPAVEEVFGLSPQDLTLRGWMAMTWKLRRDYGHLPLIDLHGTGRTLLLGALWPRPVYRTPKFTLTRRLFRLTRHPALGYRLLQHTVPQRYALALDPQAPPPSQLCPSLAVAAHERAQAQELLQSLGLHFPLALHPYATHPAKSPRPDWWRALRGHLADAGVPTVIIGRHPQPLLGNAPHDRTNHDSLRQTLALLSLCQGLVSGDSGPMHLAWGVGTPVFALFGPTTPHWGFAPHGPYHTILQAPCPKAPCSLHGATPCPGATPCLERLDPRQVAADIMAWRQRLLSLIP
jgi:ADP-heptose:LPS heptosyltransferase